MSAPETDPRFEAAAASPAAGVKRLESTPAYQEPESEASGGPSAETTPSTTREGEAREVTTGGSEGAGGSPEAFDREHYIEQVIARMQDEPGFRDRVLADLSASMFEFRLYIAALQQSGGGMIGKLLGMGGGRRGRG